MQFNKGRKIMFRNAEKKTNGLVKVCMTPSCSDDILPTPLHAADDVSDMCGILSNYC